MAGLLGGAAIRAEASTASSSNPSFNAGQMDGTPIPDKHSCKGQNTCKGTGGCKASDNGCKGKNSCKGKGGCATDGSKG